MLDPEPLPAVHRAELMLGAVIFLMSAYPRANCPRVALAITRHLESLAAHPSLAPTVRDVCRRLAGEWSLRVHPVSMPSAESVAVH